MTASLTKSFTAAELEASDALHAPEATIAAASEWTDGDLVGGGKLELPRQVSIARSLATGSYTTDPYVITGFYGGKAQSEELTPDNADGGDILRSVLLWDHVSLVTKPVMANTGGEHQMGVGDIGCERGAAFAGVELHADGDMVVQFGEPLGDIDTIPTVIANRGYREIRPTRIITNAGAVSRTTVACTIYFD